MSSEEVFKVYMAEGPIGLQRLKEEGKILDYERAEDGTYSVMSIGHIEKMEVTMQAGITGSIPSLHAPSTQLPLDPDR